MCGSTPCGVRRGACRGGLGVPRGLCHGDAARGCRGECATDVRRAVCQGGCVVGGATGMLRSAPRAVCNRLFARGLCRGSPPHGRCVAEACRGECAPRQVCRAAVLRGGGWGMFRGGLCRGDGEWTRCGRQKMTPASQEQRHPPIASVRSVDRSSESRHTAGAALTPVTSRHVVPVRQPANADNVSRETWCPGRPCAGGPTAAPICRGPFTRRVRSVLLGRCEIRTVPT